MWWIQPSVLATVLVASFGGISSQATICPFVTAIAGCSNTARRRGHDAMLGALCATRLVSDAVPNGHRNEEGISMHTL
jgi:hypothetical protein